MPAEADLEFAPKQPVPVFPLPGFVLFPLAIVPLHVFELRYRALVRDVLVADRMVGVALLKPGWERDYHGSPAFHSTGCLARVEEVQWRPDDCYDLKVLGVSRVRFGLVTREYPYRAATVELLPEEPLSDDDPLVELERRAMVTAYRRLRGESGAALDAELPISLESVVNMACIELAIEPGEKLELLELDSILERSRRTREFIERSLRRPRGRREGGERN
jgi:Lon protease-like protein